MILVLLLANGFFALSEISVVSSRKPRLALMADEGRRGAKAALALANHPEDFLSAVQVGITLVGIFSGAFGGAAFNDDVGGLLAMVPVFEPYSVEIATGLIVAVLTYFSVVVGELVPKQIALRSPEGMACIVAPPMRLLVTASRPVVWLLSASSRIAMRVIGNGAQQPQGATAEEIAMVMMEAKDSGIIAEDEQLIASRALRLSDLPVRVFMTPRHEVEHLRLDDSMDALDEKLLRANHSYLPLVDRSIDDVVGVVRVRDALRKAIESPFSKDPETRRGQLSELAMRPVMISSEASGTDALEHFRAEKSHFAVVVDEYGGTTGVLSNHDLLEALVGYIPGTGAEEDPIVRREDGSLLASGWVPVQEIWTVLGMRGARNAEVVSLAALVLSNMQGLPAVGHKCEAAGLVLEVVDMDGVRIDKVLVHAPPVALDAGG
ncbi:MAG: hemolysin family protein [Candidatus Sumerlaeia bacterium]|nr:hemolysin family protein [Candidatus Sumerlaeia bacterium]